MDQNNAPSRGQGAIGEDGGQMLVMVDGKLTIQQ